MKCNQWTVALAAAGVISLGSVANAEEGVVPNQVMTALSSTTLSGYVDTSAIWKFGTGNANMPGRAYDGPGKQDGFNLNVVKLSLERPLDESHWSAGYKVDLLFGPDASTYATTSTGVANSTSDFAVKQAYVALRSPVGNGLDLKLGVWDTIIGYEVFDSASNPNYSRSYGFFLEPTTYTGLLASYRFADWISVSGGVADPGAPTINGRSTVESIKSYMGSVVLTAPDSWGFFRSSSLYAGVIDHGKTASGSSDVINLYAGATVPTPLDNLAVGIAYDYRGSSSEGSPGDAGFISSTGAYALGLYASYRATEKLKFNLRGEYAAGSSGTFGNAQADIDDAGNIHRQEFFGVTATVDYMLWANVLSRLEFRWDRDVSGGPESFGGTSAYATDDPDTVVNDPSIPGDAEDDAVSLAFSLVYKF